MKNVKPAHNLFLKFTRTTLVVALSAGLILVAAEEKKADEKIDPAKKEENAKFETRKAEVIKAAQKVMFEEFEKGARQLQKEFPNQGEVYELLFGVAEQSEPDKALKIAQEIVDSKAAEEGVKEAAKGLLKKLGSVGKPVEIKFTAIDGREIDLSKMKDKVVLVDFWATWCGPCVRELPNVKAAYEKLHGKGLEIVGISFDKEKATLESFVTKEKMAWPQYYDGQGWSNKFGKEFGINSIPTMWLIDKKGNLRDTDGRTDLENKVEKLLAEK